jgi:hypothetical protein
MGTKNMFDVSKSLNDWREQLRQGGRCRQEDIDELEEHLREEMTKLVRIELSDEEAFLLAARRLGGVDALGEEFEKVNTPSVWLNRLRWMAVGVLVGLGASVAESAFLRLWAIVAGLMQLNFYVVGVASPLLTLGALAAIVVLAVKAVKHRQAQALGIWPAASRGQVGLLLLVFLWFTVLPIGSMMAQLLLSNYVSANNIGNLNVAMFPGRYVLSVLVPLVIAVWILRTPRWASRLLMNQ